MYNLGINSAISRPQTTFTAENNTNKTKGIVASQCELLETTQKLLGLEAEDKTETPEYRELEERRKELESQKKENIRNSFRYYA